jgi:peptidoglycan/LPS O-acetylase OafA/YrhL
MLQHSTGTGMKPSKGQLSGLYSIWLGFLAGWVQLLEPSSVPRDGWRIWVLALVASLVPAGIILVQSWSGTVDQKIVAGLPILPLPAAGLGVILSAFLDAHPELQPRTGIILGSVGVINLVVLVLITKGVKYNRPTRWSWLAATSFSAVAFGVAAIRPQEHLVLLAALYALYGFVTHYIVSVCVDNEG